MPNVAEILTVEVGSTFTKLAFYIRARDRLTLGGRVAGLTTLNAGDVSIGYRRLLAELESQYGVKDFGSTYLSSSAAGGLRIVVCGLTHNLTTKAALESALGAGGVVLKSISGAISGRNAASLEAINPNLVLLCGGLDYGEENAVLANAAAIAQLNITSVIIYAGNRAIQAEIQEIFRAAGKSCIVVDNIYPRVDDFRFREVQASIRSVFETEVVKAPGIDLIQQETTPAIPTPLAVSYAVEIIGALRGDLVVFDIGGATTDVHSYVTPQPTPTTIQASLEPPIKRTVEGDIGVFHNLKDLLDPGEEALLSLTSPVDERLNLGKYARKALRIALERHCGKKVLAHSGARPVDVIYGRDLSRVRTMLGTGGAIIYGLRDKPDFARVLAELPQHVLVPQAVDTYLVDTRYILSSVGLFAQDYPVEAAQFLEDEFKA